MPSNVLAFYGPVIHSLRKDEVTLHEKALLVVREGKVVHLEENPNLDKIEDYTGTGDYELMELGPGQFLCPGFIDLHIHAPQYPNQGLGMDKPLLDWLAAYTLPIEKKYSDPEMASTVYKYIVESTLSCGTTLACYYATIHRSTSLLLAQIVVDHGQRALIGKVSMNQNSPSDYCETTQEALEETEKFIEDISKLNSHLVAPVITPRFAISCDEELLKKLGQMAMKHQAYIQTHISENPTEVKRVLEMYPEAKHYTDVYQKASLLTKKTILGHGVYLSDAEMKLLSEKGVALAHCPNSNTLLKSGRCNVRKLWSFGVNVGLGTDVSGGSACSILDAMRSAMVNSIHIHFLDPSHTPLSFHEVFYMATIGGAICLGKEKELGNFQVGKDFDALVVDMDPGKGNTGCLPFHSNLELLQKFIYCGDDRNIVKVYVGGKPVVSKQTKSTQSGHFQKN